MRARVARGDLRYFFRGPTGIRKPAQLHGAANCLGARAAVEDREDVGDVHLYGARAEDERAGDLGIGLPLRHELEDLPLTASQIAGTEARRRALPDMLAERAHRLGDARGQW